MNQKLRSYPDAAEKLGCEHPSSREEVGRRLLAVVDAFESRQKAAEIADRSTDMLAKYIKGIVEPPFMPLARLCAAAGVRMEWLASGQEPQHLQGSGEADAPSQDLSVDDLIFALEMTDEIIREEGAKYVPRSLYARLLRSLYIGYSQRRLPVAQVYESASRFAKQLTENRGEIDDNGQKVGRGVQGGNR